MHVRFIKKKVHKHFRAVGIGNKRTVQTSIEIQSLACQRKTISFVMSILKLLEYLLMALL